MGRGDCVSAFLSGSDAAYKECAHGISILDRVIVGTPDLLVGQARTALIPALYAYWERFFRLVVSEFLRAVSLSDAQLSEMNDHLYRLRLSVQLKQSAYCRDELLNYVGRERAPEFRPRLKLARDALSATEALHDRPYRFEVPEGLIEADANVRYSVLERHFDELGLRAHLLKSELEDSGVHIFPALEKLVRTRNDIAHGTTVEPTSAETWAALRDPLLEIMNATQLHMLDHLEREQYLDVASRPPPSES